LSANISDAQDFIFRLLETLSVNNLNGSAVVRSLLDHRDIWRSVYLTSISIEKNEEDGKWLLGNARHDLISLRDLPQGHLHLDTLLVLPVPGRQTELFTLASQWNADLLEWIGISEAGRVMGGKRSVLDFSSDPERVLLYAWWD
jgi:hypothetical protein